VLTRHQRQMGATYLHRRRAEARNLLLLVTGSWLLPVLILAACALLQGCGGSSEDEDTKDNGPVDCRARPELCK
jgi:hypothetical protein